MLRCNHKTVDSKYFCYGDWGVENYVININICILKKYVYVVFFNIILKKIVVWDKVISDKNVLTIIYFIRKIKKVTYFMTFLVL